MHARHLGAVGAPRMICVSMHVDAYYVVVVMHDCAQH
jgi:hypothetical protein